jgi:hypothetical protein
MKFRAAYVLASLLLVVPLTFSQAQTNSQSTLPRLVRFGGTVKDLNGNPLAGVVGITFALYSEQSGGSALWLETQNVTADSNGHYVALLGSTKPDGLPTDLFTTAQARWVGVQVSGQAEQPRVLLVSAPYALKAGDAETLGGLPPSAFLLATPQAGQGPGPKQAAAAPGGPLTITGSGVTNFVPLWTSSSNLGVSELYQLDGRVGVGTTAPGGKLDVFTGNAIAARSTSLAGGGIGLSGISNATTGAGVGVYGESDSATGTAGVFNNVGSGKVLSGQANGTEVFSINGSGAVTGSSFQIGSNPFAFGSVANQNAFLGFAGNTSNSGTQNTATGVGALQADTTGFANTAYGLNALNANTTGGHNTALGLFALSSSTAGEANTAIGEEALALDTTGIEDTAVGHWVLLNNTTGQGNIAVGWKTLIGNTTGDNNTAIGFLTLQGNNTGSNNTALGAFANVGSSDLTNATAVGAYAFVGQSNAMVLGSINGVNGATASTKIGIGTTTPTNVFTIAKGAGHAISDGWDTYSSRRWKTNIQTLHGALEKVEQLRGVSYDLKANGKHEVGVIAEEVGAVVPEVVTWEKDSKDAQGVDYGRLTALLIEATKEQQALIHKQQEQIKAQQILIQAQEKRGNAQQAQIARLTRQVKTIQTNLKADGRSGSEVLTVKAEGTTARQ